MDMDMEHRLRSARHVVRDYDRDRLEVILASLPWDIDTVTSAAKEPEGSVLWAIGTLTLQARDALITNSVAPDETYFPSAPGVRKLVEAVAMLNRYI